MLTGAALEEALGSLPPVPFAQSYARRVPLSALLGIAKLPTPVPEEILVKTPDFLKCSDRAYRFNPPGVLNLYLGEGEATAGAETKQHPGLRGFEFEPTSPDTVFHVEVNASAILDLTSTEVQSILKTNVDELTANWRLQSPNAPTQLLGKAAFESKRFEGIRYPSAPMKKAGEEGFCIVLFRDRKLPGSTVKLIDPSKIWSTSW